MAKKKKQVACSRNTNTEQKRIIETARQIRGEIDCVMSFIMTFFRYLNLMVKEDRENLSSPISWLFSDIYYKTRKLGNDRICSLSNSASIEFDDVVYPPSYEFDEDDDFDEPISNTERVLQIIDLLTEARHNLTEDYIKDNTDNHYQNPFLGRPRAGTARVMRETRDNLADVNSLNQTYNQCGEALNAKD